MNYAVFTRDDEHSHEVGRTIAESLKNAGWIYNEEDPELVICIGGDGTILRAIHRYLEKLDSASFVGIHTGTLGFFTDYTEDQIPDFIEDLLRKDYVKEAFPLLEARSMSMKIYALNEVRIGNFAATVHYDIYIDNEFFEHTCGSGICISTQAGSTGANRGLNGAVVDKGLDILELTEIMPVTHRSHHSLKNPYIMRDDRVITIAGESLKDSVLCYDHLEKHLEDVKSITVRASEKKVRFARFKPYSYLKRLKNLY